MAQDPFNKATGVLENKWRVPLFFESMNDQIIAQLRVFHMELLRFNSRLNLISRRTEIDADIVHFSDSILASQFILKELGKGEIYDIGSGNGFPGLVLAILSPETRIVLVDKDARKIEFLKHVADKLGLRSVETLHGLVERLPSGSIEMAISRGYAPIGAALTSTTKLFSLGGTYFHMKGAAWSREVSEIPTQLCRFWSPSLVSHYSLPVHGAQMTLVKTKKVQS